MKEDPGRRLKKIEFTLGKTFSNRAYFLNALEEFVFVKYFEFEYIKTNSRRVIAKYRSEKCMSMPLLIKM